MKCKKCRVTMIRKRIAENKYVYECPKCHSKVGKVEKE